MYPKIIFKNEQSKCGSSVNATRNPNGGAIGEEILDNIGRRHILRSRQSSIQHFSSVTSRGGIRSRNNRCNICTLNNDYYVDCLSVRINRIEELVENIGKTVKVTSFSNYENKKSFFAPFTVFRSGIADFSRMDTDELVSFSNQLGTKLFPDRTVNSKRSEKTPKINRMDIRAIINSKDNYEDGNYSVVSSYIEEK